MVFQLNVSLSKCRILHLTAHFATSSLENSLEDAFRLKFSFDKFFPNTSQTAGKMQNSKRMLYPKLCWPNVHHILTKCKGKHVDPSGKYIALGLTASWNQEDTYFFAVLTYQCDATNKDDFPSLHCRCDIFGKSWT